jgi:hypothetical protein
VILADPVAYGKMRTCVRCILFLDRDLGREVQARSWLVSPATSVDRFMQLNR